MPKNDLKELRNKIAREIDVPKVCSDFLGINVEVGDRPKNLLTLSSGKNNDGLVVNEDNIYSHVTKEAYSIFDLVSLCKYGDTDHFIESLELVADRYGYMLPDRNNRALSDQARKEMQKLENDVEQWHEALKPEHIEYLRSRRITPETIEKLKIGYIDGDVSKSIYNDRIVIPTFKNGKPCFYVARAFHNDNVGEVAYTDEKGKEHKYPKYVKMYNNSWNENVIHGLDTLNRDNNYLVISEGMFDYLSVMQEDISTLSSITGASNNDIKTIVSVMKMYKNLKFVLLANDNDDSGQGFNDRIAKALIKNRINFAYVDIPKEYNGKPCKDISDYYTLGGDLNKLFESYRSDGLKNRGAVHFFANITDRFELGEALKEYCRSLTRDRVVTLFDDIDMIRGFSFSPETEEWWKNLKDVCKRPPTEKYVKDYILSHYDIVYSPLYGFLQYNGRCWMKTDERAISKIITKVLGVHERASLVKNILHLLENGAYTNRELNSKNCINFFNGTLDLLDKPNEMGKYYAFREHDKEDYCTYMLPYAYNPNAYSITFNDYLDSVTNGDQGKKTLLKEAMGYVLFKDNSLHRWFILLGRGQNGKSVFTDTLYKLFEGSVSNIPLDKFDDDRYIFNMIGKRLNLCGDEKPTLGDGIENLKKVLGGNAITVRPLYEKSSVEYVPHTKLIACMNNMPYSKDQTNGINDKIIMVKFEMHYVNENELNKDNPNERIKDIHLQDKINKDLSGVFNIALSGYQRLMENQQFTTTQEQDELKQEFVLQSNNVLEFIVQLDIKGDENGRYNPVNGLHLTTGVKITTGEIYGLYQSWCNDNYIEQKYRKDKNHFIREVNELIPEYKPSLKYIKSPNIRTSDNRKERGFVYYYQYDDMHINREVTTDDKIKHVN